MRARPGCPRAGVRHREDRALRTGGFRESAAALPLRRAPALLLPAASVCIWWMSVPLLLGLDLPYPVASLGACLFVPLAALRQWALVTTDRQVERGEEIRPVLDTATFALAAVAVFMSPALVIAYWLGCPVLASVGLVLASDLGAVLLASAVLHLTDPPP